MLRLKLAIDELRIPQQTIANLTGWSKAQISITLNSGEWPKDKDRLIESLRAFIEVTPPLLDWVAERNMTVNDMFETLTGNRLGEIPGKGAEWACEDYGKDDHNYEVCRICQRRFEGYMARMGATVKGGSTC